MIVSPPLPNTSLRLAVVGSNGEIGASIVQMAHDRGHTVVGLDMGDRSLADAPLEAYIPLDVRDPNNVISAIDQAHSAIGGFDCLINAAGAILDSSLADMTDDQLLNILFINLAGSIRLTQAATRHLRETGSGSIVLMSSMHGKLGAMSRSAYAASKGGIEAFVRSAAVELGPHGISINAVAPGPVGNGMGTQRRTQRSFEKSTPLRGPNSPANVAAAVLFLVGQDARRITGHVLPVDGGATTSFLSFNT